jgi:hypothetical protein
MTLRLASVEFFGDIPGIILYNIENSWRLFPGIKTALGYVHASYCVNLGPR